MDQKVKSRAVKLILWADQSQCSLKKKFGKFCHKTREFWKNFNNIKSEEMKT